MSPTRHTTGAPAARGPQSLLSVRGLTVSYAGTRGGGPAAPAVHDVDLDVHVGEITAVIGQSGSGKSTLAKALLRLLPKSATASGLVEFAGHDLQELGDAAFRAFRGKRIGFIPQDPGNALNPVREIGAQALEAARRAGVTSRAEARRLVLDAFARVGLPDPETAYESYPHQLSGGQLQRVLIALAIVPRPDLIIADEPTSALDATVQRRILDLISSLQRDSDTGFILITHDLAIAAEHADTVVVLKDGRVQERGRALQVFRAPRSEYTKGLLADIPGLLPHRYGKGGADGPDVGGAPLGGGEPAVTFSGVSKTFVKKRTSVRALADLSFSIPRGTTHALVGESGSGKSTAARLLLGLEAADAGTIDVHGKRVGELDRAELRALRREVQLVYQNPFTSLDPTFSVARIVAEPLERFRIGTRDEQRARVAEVLDSVGLDASFAARKPDQLSGGQRQRVAIARALAARPGLIVLDEPTSALDVTVQAEILQVLVDLQRELGVSYLFVSHDLGVVRQFADTVTVLRAGAVVESGPVERVFEDPHDEYTVRLIESIPGLGVERAIA